MYPQSMFWSKNKKKVSSDQELMQSEPKSHPQNQMVKIQIDIIQREHTVNIQMSSSFWKSGHSAALYLHFNEGDNNTVTHIKTSQYENTPMQYTAIFHGYKNGNFPMKNCDIFLIFAQNIDCGYTLEPPH